jgi:NAD(P)-dependent dehydrogenase (short-subunit alcohol dehydrogenase family)
MRFDGKTVLVTGGASGLGGATVEMVVQAGGNAVILDVNEATGNALASRLGGRVRFVKTDVTSEADVQRALDTAVQSFGGVHGAVNAAGIGVAERVLGKEGPQPLANFTRVIHINLIGTFNVIRLAAATMSKNEPNEAGERGVIVNTASVAAFDGQIGQAAYSASKAGVAGMTLPVARDLASKGIRVVTIAPGPADTPMLGPMRDDIRESLVSQIPFPKRLGRAEDFAALVKHIVENEYLNGEVIRLDGALRMGPR